jgi:hypothetical protein
MGEVKKSRQGGQRRIFAPCPPRMFAEKMVGTLPPSLSELRRAASPHVQAKSRCLAATNHHNGQITQKPVKSVCEKYSDFPKWQISLYSARLTR